MRAHTRGRGSVGIVVVIVAVVLAMLGSVASAGAQATVASFGQLAGPDGCIRALGAVAFDFGGDPLSGCGSASGLGNPQALTLSPDQRQLLVVAGGAMKAPTRSSPLTGQPAAAR